MNIFDQFLSVLDSIPEALDGAVSNVADGFEKAIGNVEDAFESLFDGFDE